MAIGDRGPGTAPGDSGPVVAAAGRGRGRRAWTGGRAGAPRLLAYALAVLLAVTGFTVLAPGAGTAEASAGGCSGRVKKVLRFSGGELRIHRSPQEACAVTVASRPGERRFMSVSLQARGGRTEVDRGNFSRKAGPVKVRAHNRCIRASGKVARSGRSSGWILC
ncbi:hypothetical protein ABT354_03500 [Streptomyces sp. NPDC000594]|uniref:hypothetical protein n=1 Tax=Streptomyces sp. NPDC000594 TaxID=3154261 RepID=UPI0033180C12